MEEEKKTINNQFSTPILFLIFNRPDKTKIVFEQIKKIKPKFLFIAADGPRDNKIGESALCNEARSIIYDIDWPCELKTLFREKNLGCRIAVSGAINWFFENIEEGIIIEDDIFPHLSFFQYCSEYLEKYRYENKVFHINSTNFVNNELIGEKSYIFSKFPIIWGWATWRRAWANYDIEMKDYIELKNQNFLKKLKLTTRQINFFEKSFDRIYSKNGYDSWDGEWEYAVMKNKGLTITPTVNLTINIGTDTNSTHKFLRDSIRDNRSLEAFKSTLKGSENTFYCEFDDVIFENWHGRSLKRIIRLIRENGIVNFIKYYIQIHLLKK